MSGGFFVRWKPGEPRECRVFSALDSSHPAAELPCPHCEDPLGDGRQVQLYAVGPWDEETRERHAEGRWYTALAVLLHVDCVTGFAAWFAANETPEAPVGVVVEPSAEEVSGA